MAKNPDLAMLPPIPRDADGPVFGEPWQAQAFALTLELYQAGLFPWTEWARRLSAEIERAQAGGDPDLGDTYYDHWLAALEKLVADLGLASPAELSKRKDAWDRAHRETPHGAPIVLRRD